MGNENYRKLSELERDVNLIAENCRAYNRPDSEVVTSADSLVIFFSLRLAALRKRIADNRQRDKESAEARAKAKAAKDARGDYDDSTTDSDCEKKPAKKHGAVTDDDSDDEITSPPIKVIKKE